MYLSMRSTWFTCSRDYIFGATVTSALHQPTPTNPENMSETSLNSDTSDKNSLGVTKKQILIIIGSSLMAIALIVGVLFASGVFDAKTEPENNTPANPATPGAGKEPVPPQADPVPASGENGENGSSESTTNSEVSPVDGPKTQEAPGASDAPIVDPNANGTTPVEVPVNPNGNETPAVKQAKKSFLNYFFGPKEDKAAAPAAPAEAPIGDAPAQKKSWFTGGKLFAKNNKKN